MQDTLTTGESQVHAAAAAGRLQELQTLTDDDSALRTVEMTEPGTACVVVSGCDGRGKSCNGRYSRHGDETENGHPVYHHTPHTTQHPPPTTHIFQAPTRPPPRAKRAPRASPPPSKRRAARRLATPYAPHRPRTSNHGPPRRPDRPEYSHVRAFAWPVRPWLLLPERVHLEDADLLRPGHLR